MREFRCQLCGDTAVVGAACPRCDVPMMDDERSRVVRIAAISLRNRAVKYYALGWVALHVIVNVALNVGRGPDTPLGLASAILGGSLFLTLALVAYFVALSRGGNARAARRLERWPPDRVATSIGAAGEGAVAIRGRVHGGRAVLEAGGMRAVTATRVRHEGPLSPSLLTRATEFTIEDEAGQRATVRASDVIVIGGVDVDGERLVPDGALVEIAGRGVRSISADRDGGYRADVRVLELSGDAKEPLMIRVIKGPREPTPPAVTGASVHEQANEFTGVRVESGGPAVVTAEEENAKTTEPDEAKARATELPG